MSHMAERLRLARPLLPRTRRPRRILAGPLRGCRLVTSWYEYPAGLLGYTESSLLRWMSTTVRPGQTWLDVGAHYGYTTLALARLVGSSGRVFAFEPVPSTVACLRETRRLNQVDHVRVVPLGLADPHSTGHINVALERGMAAPLTRTTSHVSTVPIVCLDEVWDDLSERDTRVHGVKMDVQGMELQALRGMRSALMTHSPLLALEFHTGVDREAVASLLIECGYRLPGIPLTPSSISRGHYLDDYVYVFRPTTNARDDQ